MPVFFSIINMSIAASVVAVFLLLLRYYFKKLSIPKMFYNVMWTVLAFRLVIPFSAMSALSIFNITGAKNMDIVPINETVAQIQFIDGAVPAPNAIYSSSTFSQLLKLAGLLYLIGIVILVLCYIVSLMAVHSKLRTAFLIKDNPTFALCKSRFKLKRNIKLYQSSHLDSAIIYGIFRPRIIISDKFDLSNVKMLEHVLTHELVHIMRFDYILKLVARITQLLHWFNPLIWICYSLFEKDMEASCDELALSKLALENKGDYARSIVNLASAQHNRRMPNIMAFGELSIKSRVVNITKYRKLSGLKICVVSAFIVLIGLTLTTNPVVSAKDYFSPKAVDATPATKKLLENKTNALIDALEKQDMSTLAALSSTDVSIADITLGPLKTNQYDFLKYQIYPQGETLSYSYLYFEQDICLVALWELDPQADDFVLTKLYDSKTFENAVLVKRNQTTNEDAIALIENLHRFGIIDPFTDTEHIPKSAIAGFCIDDVRTDLVRQKKLAPDEKYLEMDDIAADAKRYFNIDNFSYTFDERLFDKNKQKYIYEKNRGGMNNTDIVNVEEDDGKTIITAQTYLDSLHTIVDKTVIYTLLKDR